MDPPTPGNKSKLHLLSNGATHGNTQHAPPPPPPASYTPSSHHSSNYEPSIMPGASPSSTLTDGVPQHHHQSHQHQHQQHNHNNNGGYAPDFAQSGLAGGSYAYLGSAPITDITFDSQEIVIGVLGLPNEMMPPWLEYLPPSYVLGLFDGAMQNTNKQTED